MKGVIRKSLGLTAGLLLLVPASALAGEASVENGIPRYQAANGETNNVTVSELAGPDPTLKTIVYRDVVAVSTGDGCTSLSAVSARCNVPVATNLVRVALENGSDRVRPDVANPPSTARFSSEGGPGNDSLIGTSQNDVLDGNDGSDFINGAAGVDNLQGADDNDTIVGGVNSDTITGGSGLDNLDGNDGNDVMDGDGGADDLDGGNGNDQLAGSTGDDDLSGDAGADTLLGGAQADDLIGGIGRDSLSGGTGNDNLNADDNAGGDDLDCGEHLFDNDLAVFNLGDTVSSDCERQRVEP
jgi:Ca2+-binding RTX toxin-like protein